ncbi:CGNR zinc finger domain-containing protein [Phytohabitans kaempferiae]|uniref:CGNR zinc finger domain-containing protein n=1 Tax=Phytohabitans kaempferiae TaxID=1620943 RepID=A0ABV6MBP0_9ACTN
MGRRTRVEVRPLPISLLVYLVNEWADAPREEAGESRSPYPDVETLRAESPEFWSRFGPIDTPLLRRVANLLHPVFEAASGDECSARLNALVAEAGMAPSLASEGWSVHEVWHTDRPDRALLAAATLTLIDQLRHEPDASRLSTCEGDACVDVYVDQSPAGRRQYCSLTCQSRHRTRAYRASRRAETPRG